MNHNQTHLLSFSFPFSSLLQSQIHSYGSVYIFPWGYTNAEAPNHESFQAALGKLEHLTDYLALGPGPDHYGAASGATDDFMYATMGALSMTWELGVNFHENCVRFEDMVPTHMKGLEYLSKIAPKPFLLSKGPDIISLTVSPTIISEGVSLSITVKASDSEIAEYFKDAPAVQQTRSRNSSLYGTSTCERYNITDPSMVLEY